MREILFRGKRADTGTWVNGFYEKYNDRTLITCESDRVNSGGYPIRQFNDVSPETVGQYTGLTDKNGTRIFEGDIVADHYFPKKIGVVTFGTGSFDSGIYKYNGWTLKDISGKVDHNELYLYEDDINQYEVIGNIYDRPCWLTGPNFVEDANANITD